MRDRILRRHSGVTIVSQAVGLHARAGHARTGMIPAARAGLYGAPPAARSPPVQAARIDHLHAAGRLQRSGRHRHPRQGIHPPGLFHRRTRVKDVAACSTRDLTESVPPDGRQPAPVTFVDGPGTTVADFDVIDFLHLLTDRYAPRWSGRSTKRPGLSSRSSNCSPCTPTSRMTCCTRRCALPPGLEDNLLESYEEHHVADVLCLELSAMPADAERFDAKATVLIENVTHHIEEEEGGWFPKVRAGLGRKHLQEIGVKLEEALQKAPRKPARPGALKKTVDAATS